MPSNILGDIELGPNICSETNITTYHRPWPPTTFNCCSMRVAASNLQPISSAAVNLPVLPLVVCYRWLLKIAIDIVVNSQLANENGHRKFVELPFNKKW
jgi:hypothetical protein